MDGTLKKNLEGHVGVLARDIGERHLRRPQALAAAARYIEEQFARLGYPVHRQVYEAEGVSCANCAAVIL